MAQKRPNDRIVSHSRVALDLSDSDSILLPTTSGSFMYYGTLFLSTFFNFTINRFPEISKAYFCSNVFLVPASRIIMAHCFDAWFLLDPRETSSAFWCLIVSLRKKTPDRRSNSTEVRLNGTVVPPTLQFAITRRGSGHCVLHILHSEGHAMQRVV